MNDKDNNSEITYERQGFVVYIPGHGYVQNKSGVLTKDFAKARLYSKKGFASSSASMLGLERKYEVVKVVPVDIKIDASIIMMAELVR